MKTVEDYIKSARVQLQDTLNSPYRYSDDELKLAFDLAFDEAFRIRPDMFVRIEPETILSAPLTYEPPVPRGYQSAFLYYITGHVQLRDQEETTDSRASAMLSKFTAQLLTSAS